jgi:hypothetical protein
MTEIDTLIATVAAKPGRTRGSVEMLFHLFGRLQNVRLWIDTRHQNQDAENTPPNLILRLHVSST